LCFKTFDRQTKSVEQAEIGGVWEDREPEAFQIISWSNTASGRISATAAGREWQATHTDRSVLEADEAAP